MQGDFEGNTIIQFSYSGHFWSEKKSKNDKYCRISYDRGETWKPKQLIHYPKKD